MRLLPGWLAGQPTAAAGRSTATSRSAAGPVDRVAEPLAADGRAARGARRAASRRSRSAARPLHGIDYELPVASAQVKSLRAARRACSPTATTTVVEPDAEPRPHRAAARRAPACRVDAATADASRSPPVDELELDAIHVPGDPSSAAFHVAAARARPRLAARDRGMAASTGRASASSASSSAWARRSSATLEDARRRAPRRRAGRASSTSPHGPLAGTRVTPTRCRSRSTSCRSSRCSAASPRARRSCAGARGAAPEGVRPDRDRRRRAARARRRHRGDRRRLRRARHRRAARRPHRRPRRPPAGDARRGRRARLARGRRGRRDGGRRRLLPGLRRRSRTPDRLASARAMVVAIDGPAGAGKSTVARAVAERARLHLPRLRARCTAASRSPCRERGGEPARRRRASRSSSATACCSTAAT